MHLPTVSVRFGLMLEAYCRGCGSYMKELSNQLQALVKMEQVTAMLQSIPKKKTDDLLKCLHDHQFTSVMQDISSPLDPTLHCKSLQYVIASPSSMSLQVPPVCHCKSLQYVIASPSSMSLQVPPVCHCK